ncbi:cation:proton antiporter [Pacificimonas flava]|uniref:Na+/H+ antiporter NhaP n=1 Tax=Pacificimonas flava TaxID=1234595 RepID=M2U297_9SPHN|nr:sodium:proton antiporter [Pacificimonas flava]EMD82112.1 Na+/H+ antiporter NhaP [Pacificimonas flava]MBB5280952.1 CPA1 family monovalent cation:H+ antiporter [Pacificimonas flava]
MDLPPLSAFDAAAIIVVMAAGLGYLNHRYLKLPHVIGLTIMGAAASLIAVGTDLIIPTLSLAEGTEAFLSDLDFPDTLMQGMLSFLLFAGALHVDLDELKKGWLPILVLSTIGVITSTIIVGFLFFGLCNLIGVAIPLIWCLVFGALISPTDPVSVLGILRRAAVPPTLQATVAGESLFNDGVGVVVFSILSSAAISGADFSLSEGARLFAAEAGGGILLGLAAGYIGFRAMRAIDVYSIEVLISLAVVMGGYALAMHLHLAGPVAMAIAGLLIGNQGVTFAMSDITRDYLLKFWELIDEMLNSVLFLLIGLEIIVIAARWEFLILALAAIPLVLASRTLAVAGPMSLLRRFTPLSRAATPILVWGGLRGGISIALALSLPAGPLRDAILATTYGVVLFSVLVQGATVGRLVAWLKRRPGIEMAG